MNHRADRHRSTRAPSPSMTTRILGLPGSVRAGSYNRKLLEAARELAPPAVELELWDGLKRVPPFDEDDEPAPGATVLELRDAIARADAVLIAVPQYNASLPGQLKNALDWASRPYGSGVLRGKPVAVISASPSPSGAARAGSEARLVLGAIGARVLESEFALAHAPEQIDATGRLRAEHRDRLAGLLEQLVLAASAAEPIAVAA
jgi:chromate reductase, NAD(P)H dehydrogenase (quinone)